MPQVSTRYEVMCPWCSVSIQEVDPNNFIGRVYECDDCGDEFEAEETDLFKREPPTAKPPYERKLIVNEFGKRFAGWDRQKLKLALKLMEFAARRIAPSFWMCNVCCRISPVPDGPLCPNCKKGELYWRGGL